MILLAAHEGEEFVIALPVVMLVAAFFLMRWAAKGKDDDEDEAPAQEDLPAPATFDSFSRH